MQRFDYTLLNFFHLTINSRIAYKHLLENYSLQVEPQLISSLSQIRQQSLGTDALVHKQFNCFVEIFFVHRVRLIIGQKIVGDNGIESNARV